MIQKDKFSDQYLLLTSSGWDEISTQDAQILAVLADIYVRSRFIQYMGDK